MYVCGTETQGTVNHLCLHICQDPETGTMHIYVFSMPDLLLYC